MLPASAVCLHIRSVSRVCSLSRVLWQHIAHQQAPIGAHRPADIKMLEGGFTDSGMCLLQVAPIQSFQRGLSEELAHRALHHGGGGPQVKSWLGVAPSLLCSCKCTLPSEASGKAHTQSMLLSRPNQEPHTLSTSATGLLLGHFERTGSLLMLQMGAANNDGG